MFGKITLDVTRKMDGREVAIMATRRRCQRWEMMATYNRVASKDVEKMVRVQ